MSSQHVADLRVDPALVSGQTETWWAEKSYFWGPAPLLSYSLNEQAPSFAWRSESATDNSHKKKKTKDLPNSFDNIFVLDIILLFV